MDVKGNKGDKGDKGDDGSKKDKSQDDMQRLFLLEVLVDNLFVHTERPSHDNKLTASMADTCIMFQFLHYPPLVVCESDFIGTAVSGKDASHITFKSGKSCFFSLRTPKRPILPVPFDVKVTVIRKMKEGVLPDKLELGRAKIDLGENFTELLKLNTDENSCDLLPLSKTTKGTFEFLGENGKIAGTLTAFLRLSCFGKLVITQFSLNKEDEKKFLFKGIVLKDICKEDPAMIKGAPSQMSQGEPGRMGQGNLGGITGQNSVVRFGETVDPRSPPPPQPTKGSPGQMCECVTGPYVQGSKVGTFDPRFAPPPFLTRSPGQMYQPQVGLGQMYQGGPGQMYQGGPGQMYQGGPGQMYQGGPGQMYQGGPGQQMYPGGLGGNMNRGFDPRFPPLRPGQGASPPLRSGGGRLCDCPYPVPPSVMSSYSQRQGRNMELAPGEVGMQDDQVIFQLPLKKPGDPLTDKDKQVDSQVYYKLTSAQETKEGVQKNTVNIKSNDIPGMVTKPTVSPVSGLPVDDKHDVFLLKIGKKCEGDKKRNLELELRTPKMKEPKPPMSDRDTQYVEADCPKGSKGKGGKDDKGGKGKKDEKGGKGGKDKGGKKGKK